MRNNRESNRRFCQLVRSHYRGEMQLAECLKFVQPTLTPMATSLRRRWTPSAAFDVEDVRQEMMMHLVDALDRYRKRWDPSTPVEQRPTNFMKGAKADVGAYCMYFIHDKAKKRLHKERGANLHGNADKNKSCIPRFFDDVSRPKMGDEKPRPIESISKAMVVSPQQDAVHFGFFDADPPEAWTRVIRKAKTTNVKFAILALHHTQGRKDLAAKVLYCDPSTRLRLELGCEQDAENVVELAWAAISAA